MSSSNFSHYSSGNVSGSEEFSGDEQRIYPRMRLSKSYSQDFEEEDVSEETKMTGSSNIQKIFSYREKDGFREFFVKFKFQSYRRCDWVPEATITSTRGGKNILQRYLKKFGNFPPAEAPYFPEEYTIPDKVIGYEEYEGVKYYVVKWKGLDYDDNTYEKEDDFLKEYIEKWEKINTLPSEEELKIPPHPSPSEWKPIKEPPVSKTGRVVRSYQLEGLNFFTNHWYYKKNVILADEMGLGKTCHE